MYYIKCSLIHLLVTLLVIYLIKYTLMHLLIIMHSLLPRISFYFSTNVNVYLELQAVFQEHYIKISRYYSHIDFSCFIFFLPSVVW